MDSVGDALIVNGIHRRPKCYAPVIRMSRNCLFFHHVLQANVTTHKMMSIKPGPVVAVYRCINIKYNSAHFHSVVPTILQ